MAETVQQVILDSEENYLNETYWQILPLFQMVQSGDADGLRQSLDLHLGRYDFRERFTKDASKQMEYMAVSLVNTFMIAAIQGGVYPPEANWIADEALRRLLRVREPAAISAVIHDAALRLCEKVHETKNEDTGNPHVERAKRFILTHLTQEIGTAEVAADVGVSPYHLSRLFKTHTGQTMHGYLTDQRIEAAKRLLASDAHPIPEIAALLRFCDQSHFTGIFRKRVGITPGQYRNLHWYNA